MVPLTPAAVVEAVNPLDVFRAPAGSWPPEADDLTRRLTLGRLGTRIAFLERERELLERELALLGEAARLRLQLVHLAAAGAAAAPR